MPTRSTSDATVKSVARACSHHRGRGLDRAHKFVFYQAAAILLTLYCASAYEFDRWEGGGVGAQGLSSTAGHRIVGAGGAFVILDGAEQQQFRLFGFLPILSTATAQLACITATILALGLGGIFILRAKKRQSRASDKDSLAFLPEPVLRLALLVKWEVTALLTIVVEDIMSLVTVPVGIGRDLANRIAGRAPSSPQRNGLAGTLSERLNGRRRVQKSRDHLADHSSSSASTSDTYYSGLYNTGNSCFLNSTLQNLAAVPSIDAFLRDITAQAEIWDVPTPVTDALYDVICELNTPVKRGSAFIPRQLTDALSALPSSHVGSFFYAHQQQDAHELLVLITGALDDELIAITRERERMVQSQSLGLCAAIAPSVARDRKSLAQIVSTPFRSLVAQRTACVDCGYVEAVRHYAADELSLTVPSRAGSAITLEACLANWSKIEVVDWVCFHCSLARTLGHLRAEATYLASTGGELGTNEKRPAGSSLSAKKKSGAKRRKHREVKAKEEIVSSIMTSRLSEDEVDAAGLLAEHDIKLDRKFSRGATKQVMLARMPQILMLHINRSSYSAGNFGASKNNATVIFGEQLDLSHIVTGGDLSITADHPISRGATPMGEDDDLHWLPRGSNDGSLHLNGKMPAFRNGKHNDTSRIERTRTRYHLCGIVVHYGGHSSGHYVAFRKRKGRQPLGDDNKEDLGWPHGSSQISDAWYRISDDNVTRCSLRDVLYQNPFLLFYERVTSDIRHERDGQSQAALPPEPAQTNGASHFLNTISAPSSLADTAKKSITNGVHSSADTRLLAQGNGENRRSAVPPGFEHMQLSLQERVQSLYRPRIVERWASSSLAPGQLTEASNGVHSPEYSVNGNSHHANGASRGTHIDDDPDSAPEASGH